MRKFRTLTNETTTLGELLAKLREASEQALEEADPVTTDCPDPLSSWVESLGDDTGESWESIDDLLQEDIDDVDEAIEEHGWDTRVVTLM